MGYERYSSNQYYDHWKVPKGFFINDGITLSNFVKDIHNLLRNGQYEIALKVLNAVVIKDHKSYKFNPICAFVSLLLGIINRKSGEIEVAKQYLSHALRHFHADNDFENYARCFIAIGDTWRAQAIMNNDTLSSKKFWTRAKRYYRKANQIISYQSKYDNQHTNTIMLLRAQVLWGEARVYLALGKHNDLVQKYLLEAWRLSNTTQSIWAQEENAQLLGRYYESIKNFKEAKRWYNTSLDKAKISKNVDRLVENYLYLARLCLKNKDYKDLSSFIARAQKILSPLINQVLPENHQFYQFMKDIEELKLHTIDI